MNRTPIIATVAAGLLIAGVPPALAAAAPNAAACTQWGFNGLTSIDEGNTITFDTTGPSIQDHTFAQMIGANGANGPLIIQGVVSGGITGDQVGVGFSGNGVGVAIQGQVNPDGTAQGRLDDGRTWHIREALKCMSTQDSAKRSA